MSKEYPITLISIGNFTTSYNNLGPRYRVIGLKKKILEIN